MSSMCSKVMSQVSTETSRFVDKYDVTLDVCIPSVLSQSKVVSPNVSHNTPNINIRAFVICSVTMFMTFVDSLKKTASGRICGCLCRR